MEELKGRKLGRCEKKGRKVGRGGEKNERRTRKKEGMWAKIGR